MAGRRITAVDIQFVSLCRRGMNGLRALYKSDDGDGKGTVTLEPLVKEGSDFMERGELHAVIWLPDHPDHEGDWADAETVKKMAYTYARNGMNVDVRHDEKPLDVDDVFVAESFIIQKGDPRFEDLKNYDGAPVDPTGAWGGVFQIQSEDLRKAYRDGSWSGVSLSGPALVVDEDPPKTARFKKMAAAIDADEGDDFDMKPEELKKALDDSNTALLGGMKEIFEGAGLLKKADKKDDSTDGKPTPPAFEGDLNDPAALRKHLETLDGDDSDDGNVEESDELKKARRDKAAADETIRRLRGASNQAPDADGADLRKDEEAVTLKKKLDAGRAIAAYINGDDRKKS